MDEGNPVVFAPQLYIRQGIRDISFYSKAFGAIEKFRVTNSDDSIHVAELTIGKTIFHLHEEVLTSGEFNPGKHDGTTVTIGLFVPDVDAVMEKAVAAGATVTHPAQDYDYGYRQGEFIDPFGHYWLIEKKI
jgi:PhnB protein